jgi:uncharacterized protein (DUF2461 family)
MMTFQGWTDAVLDFYEGLEADNSKTYWQARKQVYDEQVRAPMLALLDELADEFGEGKIFTAASTLATAPRGYPRDHRRIELLRMKGVVTWKEWPVEPWLATAATKDKVVGVLRASVPLVQWLDIHVGESELSRKDS